MKSVKVREGLLDRLEIAAATEDLSVEELVDHALRAWIELWERGTEFVDGEDDEDPSDEEDSE